MRLSGVLVGVLLLGVTGCGGSAVVKPAHPFAAADDEVPTGWREELCPGQAVTVRLVVPQVLEHGHTEVGKGCGWSAPEIGRGMSVTVSPTQTLAAYREKHLDPYESDDGDDAINKIDYEDGVTVLGDEQGERLDWYSFSDGSPHDTTAVQGAGVRVQWSTPADKDRDAAGLKRVLGSVGVIEGAWHQCSSGTTRVRFQLPRQVESVEAFHGQCRLNLRKALSLHRRADVTVRPRDSLAAQAKVLARRGPISKVRLERGAATLLGRKVDRLTWLVTQRATDPDDYQPSGTWRMVRLGDALVQVTWGATPGQWETEHAAVERFLASVRLP